MEKKNNHVAAINCNNSLANAIISATTKADCCSNAAATTVAHKPEGTIRFLKNLYRDMYETDEPDNDVQIIDAHMAFVRHGWASLDDLKVFLDAPLSEVYVKFNWQHMLTKPCTFWGKSVEDALVEYEEFVPRMDTKVLLKATLNFMQRHNDYDYLCYGYTLFIREHIGEVIRAFNRAYYVERSIKGFVFFLNWVTHNAAMIMDEDEFHRALNYLSENDGRNWFLAEFEEFINKK